MGGRARLKSPMDLRFAIESILFAAQKPLTPAELRDLCRTASEQFEEVRQHKEQLVKPSAKRILQALEQLAEEHEQSSRSYRLICVAGAWQFVTRSEYAPWVRSLVGQKPRPQKLSQPALETLAIIAYRQPLTRAEAEQIRGVSVDGVVQTLLERELIEQRGRAEVVGRPMTYGTTGYFLEYFGLKSLDDLPAAPELCRIEVQRPESLQTVEPGLATTPDPMLIAPAASENPPDAKTEAGDGNTQPDSKPADGASAAPPTDNPPRNAPENQPTKQRSQSAKTPQGH